jgi:transcriptional regulator with XRE-family HTH domain
MNRLRELRQALNWSQARLIVALEKQAELDGVQLGSTRASLKTRISIWENGHSVPDETNTALLCHVFGVTEEELGFVDEDPSSSSILVPSQPFVVPSLAVTPEVVGFLANVFDQYVHADRLLGPRAVLGVVAEQCKLIDNLCKSASGVVRSEILRIGAKFFEFGGWLAHDSGNMDTAATWTAQALDMAYEAGDPYLVSYIFMRRSNIATESGQGSQGVGLAQASLREAGQLGPKLKALALRQQAGAFALVGDEAGAARAIDEALQSVEGSGESEPLATYCSQSYVQMEGAAAWTKLGRPDRAVDLLANALDSWPAEDQRDRGIGIARLATAHAVSGNIEAACAAAREATAVVQGAPSARAIGELSTLRTRLSPWRRSAEVADVTDMLRSLA